MSASATSVHSRSIKRREWIEDEFFIDENDLDTVLVDLAVARMLLLDGVAIDETNLQQKRERMIYGVLKMILKPE